MNRRGIATGHHTDAKQEAARRMRRAMTPAERVLWNALRGDGLEGLHFRRQQVIDGFIAGFYCYAAALVVEVDGPIHDTTEAYDAARTAAFAQRGLTVLRFTNDQVLTDLRAVICHILQTARNTQRPAPTPPT